MCSTVFLKKLFGAALDVSDDPWTLQLKHGWMEADSTRLDRISACLDPYDAVTTTMSSLLRQCQIKPVGKFPIPSWLWPKPKPSDAPVINPEMVASFFDSGELLAITQRLSTYVNDMILPDIPVMLGVDHSLTAGVVSALSEKYGREKLGIIVLDQHFDAIPLSVRLDGIKTGMEAAPIGFKDQFCCGDFWAYLIDEGIILPQNLIFIGVADYPGKGIKAGDSFRRMYLDYEKRGCSFFPKERFNDNNKDLFSSFLMEKLRTPDVYISMDMDVSSCAGTYAARYMEKPGLGEQDILDILATIVDQCRRGNFTFAGMDIMEINTHFLGIEVGGGKKDVTLEFIEKLFNTVWGQG
jgi:arginase family enzyme